MGDYGGISADEQRGIAQQAVALRGELLGRARHQAVEQRGLGEFLARVGVAAQPGCGLAQRGFGEGAGIGQPERRLDVA